MADTTTPQNYIITTIFRDKVDSHLLTQVTTKVVEVVESIVLTPTELESNRVVEHTFNANLSTKEFDDITQALYEIGLEHPEVNSFIQVDNEARRFKSLFVFDMDSTLIKEEVIDLMAEIAGCEDKIKVKT
jgi:phosphoserine phosphatase